MSVNITARGSHGHRDFKHFYRDKLDAQAMRTLMTALDPLLPEYSAFIPADEDEWEFYGASVSDLHPDLYNDAMATLRASASDEVKAAIAKIGDGLLTELGSNAQLVSLGVNPWRKDGEVQFSTTMSTDGNALDEPRRNTFIHNAQAMYREYGLSEPNGEDWHLVLAADVLKAAEGRRSNDLVKIATWAVKTFGPEATVSCH